MLFKLKYIIFLICGLVQFSQIGCGIFVTEKKLKEHEKKLEEMRELVLTQQILLEKLSKNERVLSKKMENIDGTYIQVKKSPSKIPDSSKKKLFIMKIKLNNFNLRYNSYPDDVQELKSVLDGIPVEDRSDSNIVHVQKNGQGGWVYDPDSGELYINSYNKKN